MIETRRLKLHPLTHSQLLNYLANDQSLEKELNVLESSREISAELREALETTIIANAADTTKNYLYSTLWTLIEKTENKMVGELCMMGEPNEKGEIEIGYGTYEQFQNNGYMTEAVSGLIQWAENQQDVRFINATTDRTNIASFTVLIKNRFIRVGKTESLYLWQLNLEKH